MNYTDSDKNITVGMILHGNPSYKDLQNIYSKWFSLGGIAGQVDNKFALISLICFLTANQKKKNPDTTCYEVIQKVLSKGTLRLEDDYVKGLSIVCEDFLKGSTEFNTCGLKTVKEIVGKINEILSVWLPF